MGRVRCKKGVGVKRERFSLSRLCMMQGCQRSQEHDKSLLSTFGGEGGGGVPLYEALKQKARIRAHTGCCTRVNWLINTFITAGDEVSHPNLIFVGWDTQAKITMENFSLQCPTSI